MPQASATFAMMRLARSRMPPRYSAQCEPPTAGWVVVVWRVVGEALHALGRVGSGTDSRNAWISSSVIAELS